MGNHGASSGRGGAAKPPAIQNDFQSSYGLPNVGTREEFTSYSGSGTRGTAHAKVDDVQAYFDTGAFDNFGTGSQAKREIVKRIERDMSGRGFDVRTTEDKTKLELFGEDRESIVVTIGQRKGKWVASTSRSTGSKGEGGFKLALSRASGLRR